MSPDGSIFQEGDQLLKRGDNKLASEKYWNAVETAIRNVAHKRHWPCETHRDVLIAASKMSSEDHELARLFPPALSLFFNSSEDWLSPETVALHREDALRFIEKADLLARATTV